MVPSMYAFQPWQQFEDLVRQILEANGFNVVLHSPRGDPGYDFRASRGDEGWAVEVKYYRTNRAQPRLLEAAAARVAHRRSGAQELRGMLVVSCVIPPPMRMALEQQFGVTFIDRLDLDALASKDPLLTGEVQALLG